jgi:hypothetical protein
VTRPPTTDQEATLAPYERPPPPNDPDAPTRQNVRVGPGKWTVLGCASVCRGLVSRGLAEAVPLDPARPLEGNRCRLSRAGKALAAKPRQEEGS